MKKPRKQKDSSETPINRGRHEALCTICAHKHREEIEAAFVNWASPAKIANEFKITRDSLYRHAKAADLFTPRQRNVRAALEKIIERAGEVEVNAAAVVSAVTTYAKLNSQGQIIERRESVDVHKLFERMTAAELDEYAKCGRLPAWFTEKVGATAPEGQEDVTC